jgi:hypothetical protein
VVAAVEVAAQVVVDSDQPLLPLVVAVHLKLL